MIKTMTKKELMDRVKDPREFQEKLPFDWRGTAEDVVKDERLSVVSRIEFICSPGVVPFSLFNLVFGTAIAQNMSSGGYPNMEMAIAKLSFNNGVITQDQLKEVCQKITKEGERDWFKWVCRKVE